MFELLLGQEKSEIASRFFNLIPTEELFVSDFSVHSIGVILSRLKKNDVFDMFINDLFIHGQLEQLALDPVDLLEVNSNIRKYKLDFDDSYQFTISQKFDLTIVTFDKDFNIRGINKKSPDEVIENK